VWSGANVGFTPGSVLTFTLNGTVGTVCGPVLVSNTAFANASSACSATAMVTNETDFALTAPLLSVSVVKTQTPASGSSVAIGGAGCTLSPSAAGLTVAKNLATPAASSTVSPGTAVTYTIVVTNSGAATLSSLTVVDTLSPLLTGQTPTAVPPFVITNTNVA